MQQNATISKITTSAKNGETTASVVLMFKVNDGDGTQDSLEDLSRIQVEAGEVCISEAEKTSG